MIDLGAVDDVGEEVRSRTGGRGADAVVDAVGMEAHGSPVAEMGQRIFNVLPKRVTAPLMNKVGVDRMAAIYTAIDAVRRGGTVSLIGVYGGQSDPMPMLTMFDKQIQLRMGQANIKRWVDDIMPLLLDDDDPLGTEAFATHHVSLDDAPAAYESFQKKQDGTVKVVFKTASGRLTAQPRGSGVRPCGRLARCHSTRTSPACSSLIAFVRLPADARGYARGRGARRSGGPMSCDLVKPEDVIAVGRGPGREGAR